MALLPILRTWFTALFLLASPALIPTEKLIEDTVNLDRTYIPALTLTGLLAKDKSAAPKIQMAVARFSETWRSFRTQYAALNPSDPYWIKDFDHIDIVVAEAEKSAAEKNFARSHEELEEVRETFLLLRKRNRLDYYLDSLTEYHSSMEGIVLLLEGKKPKNLTASDLENVRSVTAEAFDKWAAVTNYSKRIEPFQMDEGRIRLLDSAIAQNSITLSGLNEALENADRDAILKNAKVLKPGYQKLFSLFGDFGK